MFYAVMTTAAHAADPTCSHNLYLPPGSLLPYDPATHPAMLGSYFDLEIDDLPSVGHPGHYVRVVGRAR